jgi:hypothetical protein
MNITAIPEAPGEINEVFLTEVLQSAGLLTGAVVSGVEVVDPAIGVGMTAQIARLRLSYSGEAPDAPKTVIAKLSAVVPEIRGVVNFLGFYEREVRFYEHAASKMDFRSPAYYAGAFDSASGKSILLIEDLGALACGNWERGCSAIQAEILVRLLARMHAAWWESPSLADFPWLYRFDSPLGQSVSKMMVDRWPLLVEFMGKENNSAIEAISTLLDGLHSAMQRMILPPFTLIHGDYQLENMFFDLQHPENEPVVADFQICMLGRGPYDLGYFLGSNMEPVERRMHEEHLLQVYYNTLLENGVEAYRYEDFLDDYRFGLLHGIIRFAFLLGNGPADNPVFLKVVINRFSAAIEDHKAWELLEDL